MAGLIPINRLAGLLHEWWSNDDPLVDRMSMLPIGQHEDGSLTVAMPGMITDVLESAKRMATSGPLYEPDPESPRYNQPGQGVAADAYNTRSAMDAFTVASLGPLRVGAAKAAGVGVKRPVLEEQVFYRGTDDVRRTPDVWWASDDPVIASTYTAVSPETWGLRPAVTPGHVRLEDPMIIDAKGARFDDLRYSLMSQNAVSTDDLLDMARARGNDGLVVRNVIDPQSKYFGVNTPSTVVAALRPNTVRSSLTGDILFANNIGAALPAGVSLIDAKEPNEGRDMRPDKISDALLRMWLTPER